MKASTVVKTKEVWKRFREDERASARTSLGMLIALFWCATQWILSLP